MEFWYSSTSDGEWIPRPSKFGNLVDLVATLVQIIAALVVLSLTMAKDEHPQAFLLIWVIGYTCACIATVPILSWRFHTYINQQDPSLSTPYIALAADEENNIQVAGDEYSRERKIHKVMDFFKTALECFFVGWFFGYVYVLFFFDNSSQDYSILRRLSIWFCAYSIIRYGIYIITCYLCPFALCGLLVFQVNILISEAIMAFYACVIRSFDVDSGREGEGEDIVNNNYHGLDSERESDGEDISCCCICLRKYGDKDEQMRKLACLHVFHPECIEMWVRIKPSCPLCLSEINMSPALPVTCV